MRKLKGKWYIRVYLDNGKEKLLPTKTGDRKRAEAMKRQIEEREFLVKAKLAEKVLEPKYRLSEVIDEYLKDCRARLRESTVIAYALALGDLITCWGDVNLNGLAAVHLISIKEYLVRKVNPTTVNIRLRGIRAFLNWLQANGKIDSLPGKVSLVKIDRQLPKFFTPQELDKIFSAIEEPKLKAVYRLLSETGLRRMELFNCTLEGEYLHLHDTKGRRDRLVHISPELIPDYILATTDPYHPDTITQYFRKAMLKAGIEPNGRSLHSLRHTFALRRYAHTGDIYLVKELLGHSSAVVTEIYLQFPQKYLAQVFGSTLDRSSYSQIMAESGPPIRPEFQA
ncbi:MAG: site-specific integrase [Candidatus Marinimicrobia bacterium]|nr:site-specific integrase [Candidatus Neomarinimicrobiota bacterium]